MENLNCNNKFIELYLPWPPTVNNYYLCKKVGNRYIKPLTKQGREYRKKIREAIHRQHCGKAIENKIMVLIIMYPPDNRKRDLDNYKKALFDGCSKDDKDNWKGLWNDDSQIDQDFSFRGKVTKGGLIYMKLFEAGPVLPDPKDIPPGALPIW